MNVDTDGNRMVWDERLRQWVPVTGALSPAELANEMQPVLSSWFAPYGVIQPTMASGYYYATPYANVTTRPYSAGDCYFTPISIDHDLTIDRIAAEVTTLGAGSTVRLGIYAADGAAGRPSTLILDAGTIDGTSTGVKTVTVSQALTRGLYWLAAAGQGGTPTLRGSSVAVPVATSTSATEVLQNSLAGYIATGVTAALASAPSVGVTTIVPRIAIRVV